MGVLVIRALLIVSRCLTTRTGTIVPNSAGFRSLESRHACTRNNCTRSLSAELPRGVPHLVAEMSVAHHPVDVQVHVAALPE